MAADTVRTSHASDYAVLEAGEHSFYYGYEYDLTEGGTEVWGFEYTRDGETRLRLPWEVLAVEEPRLERFAVGECLLLGIGHALRARLVSPSAGEQAQAAPVLAAADRWEDTDGDEAGEVLAAAVRAWRAAREG